MTDLIIKDLRGKQPVKTPLSLITAGILTAFSANASDLVISGVVDASLTGGLPKAVELYVVNDIPDLKNAFKKKELLVMLKTTVFVTDIIIATKEDESNLMNNKQRFEILNKILKSINLVEAETQSLYYFFKGIQTISVLDNYETADIDYSGVLSQLEDDYDQIFPETLKDEN